MAGAVLVTEPPSTDVDRMKDPAARAEPRVRPWRVTVKADVVIEAAAVVITIEVLVEVTAGAEPVKAPTDALPATNAAVPRK